jgi:transposase-like protein
MKKYTMKDFDREFPDDSACLEWIKSHRWPNGIYCQKCQKITKHHRVANRTCYECDWCGTQVYPTAGTIFHKSSTSLRTWFQAIYQMASTRCGISAKQIERESGVTYKTAWRMFHQIRKLLDEDAGFLSGQVEADETYVGGRRKGKRGRGAEGKSILAGIAERKGKIMARKIPNVQAVTLMPIIRQQVLPESTIYTDELASYNKLVQMGYLHRRIHHALKLYVVGDIHTNTVDGFWSLLKRGIVGVYHTVSDKHLQSYVDEYVFRYNHSKDEKPMFKTFLARISSL